MSSLSSLPSLLSLSSPFGALPEPFAATWLALLEPFLSLADPSKRVFVPFLFGALLLATWVTHRRGEDESLLGALFPRAVFLHPSARLDYKLLFAKALIRALLLAPFLVSTLSIAAAVATALRSGIGEAPACAFSALSVAVLYTLCSFLLDDWTRFALHRLMHRVPALWELHKVHHSAEVLTPFTLYRTHPIESLLNTLRGSLSMGLVTGVFVWAFGARVHGWQIFSVDAIGFVWSLAGANLRHSHIWLSYGRRWEHLLLSPAQHQIHHSDRPVHHDRNFGTVLSLWDWLGGSLYVTGEREVLRFGLPAAERNHQPTVPSLLLAPLLAATGRLLPQTTPAAPGLRALTALSLATLLLSCDVGTRFDRGPLLRAFADCTVATYREFDAAVQRLAAACATAADAPSAASQGEARAAWEQAIDRWQQAESMQLGPAAYAPSPGALGLRAAIYSWPDTNRCLIEQQLVSGIYQTELFATTPENSRGLAALEYLLFYEGSDNACDASVAINASGSWAALSTDELARRKRAYARFAAQDLVERSRALLAAWDSGGFGQQLVTAGQGSRLFSTTQAGVNAVADALYYLDTLVKDRKLAQPLGLRDCAQASCPEAVESPYAARGSRHLRNNLVGFQRLFLGCGSPDEGLGFDDLLRSAGATALEQRMRSDLASAQQGLDALKSPSLAIAITQEREAVQGIHDAIKRITDALKADFTIALQISPPKRVEGDQD